MKERNEKSFQFLLFFLAFQSSGNFLSFANSVCVFQKTRHERVFRISNGYLGICRGKQAKETRGDSCPFWKSGGPLKEISNGGADPGLQIAIPCFKGKKVQLLCW